MRQEYGCDDADDGARENERVRAYKARRWYTDKDDANDLQKRGQTRTKGMKKRRWIFDVDDAGAHVVNVKRRFYVRICSACIFIQNGVDGGGVPHVNILCIYIGIKRRRPRLSGASSSYMRVLFIRERVFFYILNKNIFHYIYIVWNIYIWIFIHEFITSVAAASAIYIDIIGIYINLYICEMIISGCKNFSFSIRCFFLFIFDDREMYVLFIFELYICFNDDYTRR